MKIIVFGAHPDDPESGCGGMALQHSMRGDEVVFAYATTFREGRCFFGEPEQKVRTEEAETACRLLGVRPYFFPYPHETISLTPPHRDEVTEFFERESPDIVVVHWPVDTHPDHRAVGVLGLDAYLRLGTPFVLYFFEVMTGVQSLHFHPTHYVDITAVAEKKREATFLHKSQQPENWWGCHKDMHRMRGRECGVELAEAYIKVDRSSTVSKFLPGRGLYLDTEDVIRKD